MSKKDEALKLALETSEGIVNADWRKWDELASPSEFERWAKSRANFMATILREALAEQPAQQEPFGYFRYDLRLDAWVQNRAGLTGTPFYTSPQRTWVGLTDEERNDCLVSADPCEALAEPEARQLMEDVEAKLKEKNT